MEYLQWHDRLEIDESIKRFEYQEYEPYTGADLNNSGDIRINIQNQDEFLLPNRSYLYIEGALFKSDKKSRFDQKKDKISLVNNGLMYLFSRVDYQLGNEIIEEYSNPSHASTIKGLLTYPKQYPEGMSFMWCPDCGTGKTSDNYGFTQRRDILNDGSEQGNFCGIIPLTHMFGFCENYDKVMYGIRHQLILRRASTNANAILKSDEKNGGDDKVPDGGILLTRISWRIPHLKLSDDNLIKLSHDIQSRVKLDINYLNRQCERIEMEKGHTQFDWRLNITAGAEKPRYIILGFQTDKEDKQTENSTSFNHCSLNNANVFLNSERYPEMDLQLDFYRNGYTAAYKIMCDYMDTLAGEKRCAITMGEYRYLYPLFVFDVSRQSEKLKNAVTDIRIRASFKKNIPDKTVAYALILSERMFKLESDGTKLNIVF